MKNLSRLSKSEIIIIKLILMKELISMTHNDTGFKFMSLHKFIDILDEQLNAKHK